MDWNVCRLVLGRSDVFFDLLRNQFLKFVTSVQKQDFQFVHYNEQMKKHPRKGALSDYSIGLMVFSMYSISSGDSPYLS